MDVCSSSLLRASSFSMLRTTVHWAESSQHERTDLRLPRNSPHSFSTPQHKQEDPQQEKQRGEELLSSSPTPTPPPHPHPHPAPCKSLREKVLIPERWMTRSRIGEMCYTLKGRWPLCMFIDLSRLHPGMELVWLGKNSSSPHPRVDMCHHWSLCLSESLAGVRLSEFLLGSLGVLTRKFQKKGLQ